MRLALLQVGLMALLLPLAGCVVRKAELCDSFDPCGDHGVCDDSQGEIACVCDTGYGGAACASCAAGYEPGSGGTCVRAGSCAGSQLCGDHGTCDDSSGTIGCVCDAGWAGALCDGCAAGFHDDGAGGCALDDHCLPSTCSGRGACTDGSGTVSCACTTGYAGTYCESCATDYHRAADGGCAPDESCTAGTCGAHGTCAVTGGVAACTCAAGYTGAACDGCAAGFHDAGGGACAADDHCLASTCSGHGACADGGGTVSCSCSAGYAGSYCESCDAGFHRDPTGGCAADETCAGVTCSGHGSCVVSGGVAACLCAAGYAGADCAACGPGFHDDGRGGCALDEQCLPSTCSGHGNCSVTAGVAGCVCGSGYEGDYCESCKAGFHRNAAGDCAPDETCNGVDCGLHGACVVTNGVASCQCDPGYVRYAGTCIPALLGGDHISAHAWSPDGSRLAVVKCPPQQGWDCALFTTDPSLGDPQLVRTGIAWGGLADWQGNAILFTPDVDQGLPPSYNGEGEYFSIAPDGTGLTQVTFTYSNGIKSVSGVPAWANVGTARWARFVPGTTKVYFLANDGNGWYKSFLCNADGSDGWSNVSSGWSWTAAVSPTGNKLLYGATGNYAQPADVHAVNPDLSGNATVAAGLTWPPEYVVSPNGGKVAYAAGASGRDIHVVNIDGTGNITVLADAWEDVLTGFIHDNGTVYTFSFPTSPWTPDGQRLIFSSNRAGHSHLFSVKLDGSELTQLTGGEYYDFAPNVSPDSTHLSYLRVRVGFDPASPWPTELVVEPW